MKQDSSPRSSRSEVLEGAPLHYAPENELGVVFLFAHLAPKWRLRIEEIRSAFPDCIAYQKAQGRENRIRIEFEFKSRSFSAHGHSPKGCDWVVCWEDNWPDAPAGIQIVELRKWYGLGFNVWIVPVRVPYNAELGRYNSISWSAPPQAHKGDLVLFYLTRPEMSIQHVFALRERATKVRAGWRKGMDCMAEMKRVCTLKAPVFYEDLCQHRILRTSAFVRAQMQGRWNATEYWTHLYDMIIRRNPGDAKKLSKFAPAVLA